MIGGRFLSRLGRTAQLFQLALGIGNARAVDIQIGTQRVHLVMRLLQLAHEICDAGLGSVEVVLQILAGFWVHCGAELALIIALALAQLALIGLDAQDFGLHVIDGHLRRTAGIQQPLVLLLGLVILGLFRDFLLCAMALRAFQVGQLQQYRL